MKDRICPLKPVAKPHTSTSVCDKEECMWYIDFRDQCIIRAFYDEAIRKGWRDK